MKSISASIVLLSGTILLAAGSFIAHDQTKSFLQLVGAAVGLIGLGAWWFWTFKQPKDLTP